MRQVRFRVYEKGQYTPYQIGVFHQWGLELFDNSSCTVAIVEDENGKIKTVHPSDIQFLDKTQKM